MHSHDNPPKNRVRNAWMDFLPASFDLPTNQPVGLYMPGVENLELPGYLAKGLVPRQLIGVERELDRLRGVVRSAAGIRVIAGTPLDAVNILARERIGRLSFAWADLEGSYDNHVNQILALFRVMPPDDERPACLAVTSYAARAYGLRTGLANASKFASGIDDVDQVATQIETMQQRYDVVAAMLSTRNGVKRFSHLWRELGYLWWTVIGMGLIKPREEGPGTLDLAYLHDELSPALKQIESRLKDGTGEGNLVRDRALADRLERRTVRLWPTAFRHILYYSPQHQPMQTWFLKFWKVEHADGLTMRDLLRQVWDLAVRAPLTFVSKEGMDVTINNQ
ncbi:hypothetical protein EBS80_01550 [bacterium]|nr:hypothetical protein [bacterium]